MQKNGGIYRLLSSKALKALIVLLAFVSLASEYIRELSVKHTAVEKTAESLLSLTDSSRLQWLTATALAIYSLVFFVWIAKLRQGSEVVKTSIGHRLWKAVTVPEILIITFVALCFTSYTLNYEVAYNRSDFLTLLAGIAFGQAFVWACLFLRSTARSDSPHQTVVSTLIFLLVVAALFHPDMGRNFQYRDTKRWQGPFYNPNTYGPLMGVAVTLSLGRFFECLGSAGLTRRGFFTILNRAGVLSLVYASSAAITAYGLLKSYSRAAWLATGVATAYLMYVALADARWKFMPSISRLRTDSRWNAATMSCRRFIPRLLVMFSCLIVVAFWNFRTAENRLVRRTFSVGNINDFSWRNRALTSVGAFQMISDKPWWGFGWNEAADNYNAYYRPSELSEGYAVTLDDYLMIGMSTGIPVLFCLIFYLGAKYFRGHISGPASVDSKLSWAMATCRAASIVPLLAFIPQKGIFYIAIGMPFWALIELGSESIAIIEEPEKRPAKVPVATRLLNLSKRPSFIGATAIIVIGLFVFISASQRKTIARSALFSRILADFRAAQPIAVNVSPDGQRFLTKIEEGGAFKVASLSVNSSQSPKDLVSSESQRSLTWRPDGEVVAYQETAGMNRPFYLWNLKTGETRRLNVPVSKTALPPLRWNRGGNRLACFTGSVSYGDLMVIDPNGDEEPTVVQKRISSSCDFVWSPDSSMIAFITISKPGIVAIKRIDATDSALSTFDLHAKLDGGLAWSPDGKSILVCARANTDEFFKLYALDIQSGGLTLQAEAEGDISNPVYMLDGRRFIYHVLSDGIVRAVLVNKDTQVSQNIGPTNGVFRITHPGKAGTSAYGRYASLTDPPKLVEVDLQTLAVRTVYAPAMSEKLKCPEPESVRIKSFDGILIPAYHWKAARDTNSPLKVVVEVHGGLHTQTFPTWEPYIQSLVKRGIDVLSINYRGSSGFGRTLETNDVVAQQALDVLAARDYAVNVLNASPTNICLMGNSHGSGLVAAAAAHGEQIGGLVLISWAGLDPKFQSQIKTPFTVVEFQGELDPFVKPDAAQAAIDDAFKQPDHLELPKRAFRFKDEGHFFYETDSWATISEQICLLMDGDL